MKRFSEFLAENQRGTWDVNIDPKDRKDTPAKKAIRAMGSVPKSVMTGSNIPPQLMNDKQRQKYTDKAAKLASSVTKTKYDAGDPNDKKGMFDGQSLDDVRRQTIAKFAPIAAKQAELQKPGTPEGNAKAKRREEIAKQATAKQGAGGLPFKPNALKASGTQQPLTKEMEAQAGGIEPGKLESPEDKDPTYGTQERLAKQLGLDPETAGKAEIIKAMADGDGKTSDLLDTLDSIRDRQKRVTDRMAKAGEQAIIQGVDSKTPMAERDLDDAVMNSLLSGHEENVILGGGSDFETKVPYRPESQSTYGYTGAGIFPRSKKKNADGTPRFTADVDSVTKMISAMQDPEREGEILDRDEDDKKSKAGFKNPETKISVRKKDQGENSSFTPDSTDPTAQDYRNFGVIEQADMEEGASDYMNALADKLEAEDYDGAQKMLKMVDLPDDPVKKKEIIDQVKKLIPSGPGSELAALALRGQETGSKSGGIFGGDMGDLAEEAWKFNLSNPESEFYQEGAPSNQYAITRTPSGNGARVSAAPGMSKELFERIQETRLDAMIETMIQQGGGDGYNPFKGVESYGNMDLEHLFSISPNDPNNPMNHGWDEPTNWIFADSSINRARGNTPLAEHLRDRATKATQAKDYFSKYNNNDKWMQGNQEYFDKAFEKYPDLEEKFKKLGIDPRKARLTGRGSVAQMSTKDGKSDLTELMKYRKKLVDGGIPKNVAEQLTPTMNIGAGAQEYDTSLKTKRAYESQVQRAGRWIKENEGPFKERLQQPPFNLTSDQANDYWNDRTDEWMNRAVYRIGDENTPKNRPFFSMPGFDPDAKPEKATAEPSPNINLEVDDDFDLSAFDDIGTDIDVDGVLGDLTSAIEAPEAKKPAKKVSTKPSEAQLDKAIADARGEKLKMDETKAQAMKDFIAKNSKSNNNAIKSQVATFKKQLKDAGFADEEEKKETKKETKPKRRVTNSGRGRTYKEF